MGILWPEKTFRPGHIIDSREESRSILSLFGVVDEKGSLRSLVVRLRHFRSFKQTPADGGQKPIICSVITMLGKGAHT